MRNVKGFWKISLMDLIINWKWYEGLIGNKNVFQLEKNLLEYENQNSH